MREILFRGFQPCEDGEEKVFIKGEWIEGVWRYGFLNKTRNMNTKPHKLEYCIDNEEKGVMK